MKRQPSSISAFFLNEAGHPSATEVGMALATNMIAIAKRDFPDVSKLILLGYLNTWNQRGGSPFSVEELKVLIETPPAPKKKSARKSRHLPTPGVALFEE